MTYEDFNPPTDTTVLPVIPRRTGPQRRHLHEDLSGVEPCVELALRLRPCYGPRGLVKSLLFRFSKGYSQVSVSNPDTASVLASMNLKDRQALTLASAAATQAMEHGDGAGLVLLLASSLLIQARKLLALGVTGAEIQEGYRLGCGKALVLLQQEVCGRLEDPREELQVRAILRPFLASWQPGFDSLLEAVVARCCVYSWRPMTSGERGKVWEGVTFDPTCVRVCSVLERECQTIASEAEDDREGEEELDEKGEKPIEVTMCEEEKEKEEEQKTRKTGSQLEEEEGEDEEGGEQEEEGEEQGEGEEEEQEENTEREAPTESSVEDEKREMNRENNKSVDREEREIPDKQSGGGEEEEQEEEQEGEGEEQEGENEEGEDKGQEGEEEEEEQEGEEQEGEEEEQEGEGEEQEGEEEEEGEEEQEGKEQEGEEEEQQNKAEIESKEKPDGNIREEDEAGEEADESDDWVDLGLEVWETASGEVVEDGVVWKEEKKERERLMEDVIAYQDPLSVIIQCSIKRLIKCFSTEHLMHKHISLVHSAQQRSRLHRPKGHLTKGGHHHQYSSSKTRRSLRKTCQPSRQTNSTNPQPGLPLQANVVVEEALDEEACRKVTLTLRSPDQHLLDSAQAAVAASQKVYHSFLAEPRLVTGAGAAEVSLAVGLTQVGLSLVGMEQLVVHAFSQALLEPAKALGENSGTPADLSVLRLYGRHWDGNGEGTCGQGLTQKMNLALRQDQETKQGVVDGLGCKASAIQRATEATLTILSELVRQTGEEVNRQVFSTVTSE